jgi:hypothetical protein
VFVAKGLKEKRLQKALILYWNPEHWDDVREALQLAGREDLIGRGPGCLVPAQTAAERDRLKAPRIGR